MPTSEFNMGSYADPRSAEAEVKIGTYSDRLDSSSSKDRYNSEDSMEDNNSNNSSLDSSQRQQDFSKKDNEFIPTRASGILASKPALNPGQFTRINSNPLLISAQKQLLLVQEVKKKKKEMFKEQPIGDENPEWQSDLDMWKHRRRKQSEEALSRVAEFRRAEDAEFGNGSEVRKWSIGKKISGYLVDDDDEIDLGDLPSADDPPSPIKEVSPYSPTPSPQPSSSPQPALSPQPTSSQQQQQHSHNHENEDNHYDESSDEPTVPSSRVNKGGDDNPYQTAIEGYKSFAQSHLSTSEKNEHWESAAVHSRYPTGEGQTRITIEEEVERDEPRSSLDEHESRSSLDKQNTRSSDDKKEQRSSNEKENERSNKLDEVPPTSSKIYNSRFKSDANKTEDEWETTIESITQPIRKPSSENISDKMKMKLAKFAAAAEQQPQPPAVIPSAAPTTRQGAVGQVAASIETGSSVGTAAAPPPRNIQPDNTFKDKLKAFKNIEISAGVGTTTASTVGGLGKRRESEPQLPRAAELKTARSTSSSSLQNNKFFQQDRQPERSESGTKLDSLSSIKGRSSFNKSSFNSFTGGLTGSSSGGSLSAGPSSLKEESSTGNKVERFDSLRSEGGDCGQLLEDALEESFSQLEQKNKVVFRAEDFVPSVERLAPPADKPPPLPAPPPPPPTEDVSEEAIAAQEREIIESIEREEREINQSKKKSDVSGNLVKEPQTSSATAQKKSASNMQHSSQHYAASNTAHMEHNGDPSGELQHSRSASSIHAHQQGSSAGYGVGVANGKGMRSESTSALKSAVGGRGIAPENVRREKDYNKHWLIQEAEQRRINEAKQKQFEAAGKTANKSSSVSSISKHQSTTSSSYSNQQQNFVQQHNNTAVNNHNHQQLNTTASSINSYQQQTAVSNHHSAVPGSRQVRHAGASQPNLTQTPANPDLGRPQQAASYGKLPQMNNINTAAPPPATKTPRGHSHAATGFASTDNYVNVTSEAQFGGQMPPIGGQLSPSGGGYGGDLQENIYANVDPEQQYLNRTSSSLPPGSEMAGQPRGPQEGHPRGAPQVAGGPHLPPRSSQGGATTQQQDRVLSVSGKKKCSACREELGRGAAMIIETLRLFYHIKCFNCCVCSVQLGNGAQGTDVRVRNNRLHCQNCYSNDEGLKFSKV